MMDDLSYLLLTSVGWGLMTAAAFATGIIIALLLLGALGRVLSHWAEDVDEHP